MMMMLLKTQVTVVHLDTSAQLKVVTQLPAQLVPPIVYSSKLVKQLVNHVVLQVTAQVRVSPNLLVFVQQDTIVRLEKLRQHQRIRYAQLVLNALRDPQLLCLVPLDNYSH
jgi:hypothetical protein